MGRNQCAEIRMGWSQGQPFTPQFILWINWRTILLSFDDLNIPICFQSAIHGNYRLMRFLTNRLETWSMATGCQLTKTKNYKIVLNSFLSLVCYRGYENNACTTHRRGPEDFEGDSGRGIPDFWWTRLSPDGRHHLYRLYGPHFIHHRMSGLDLTIW